MTFEQWWNENVETLLLEYGIVPEPEPSPTIADIKKRYARCWNGALGAATERMLICCCGHSRGEHNSELGACQHENCTCIQVCDCWVIVTEAREEEHPRILEEAFQKLKA